MHRFLYLARRRADLEPAAFLQRWREHEQLASHCADVLAEVRGYRQWQVTDELGDDVAGVAETRCADAAAVYRMLACAGTREVLQPDELRFLAVPCRESGLVADETVLAANGAAGDHACLWLMPRSAAAAVDTRLGQLHELHRHIVGDAAGQLSAGRRDAADALSPFAALLFARLPSPAAARRLAAAWRADARSGENVRCLQRVLRA